MKPITFPEVNVRVAENQEQYETLPSFVGEVQSGVQGVICCFEVSPEEVKRLSFCRKIWFQALTFGQPLQPFMMTIEEDYFLDKPAEETKPVEYANNEFVEFKLNWRDRLKALITGEFVGCVRVEKKLFPIGGQDVKVRPENL